MQNGANPSLFYLKRYCEDQIDILCVLQRMGKLFSLIMLQTFQLNIYDEVFYTDDIKTTDI